MFRYPGSVPCHKLYSFRPYKVNTMYEKVIRVMYKGREVKQASGRVTNIVFIFLVNNHKKKHEWKRENS